MLHPIILSVKCARQRVFGTLSVVEFVLESGRVTRHTCSTHKTSSKFCKSKSSVAEDLNESSNFYTFSVFYTMNLESVRDRKSVV